MSTIRAARQLRQGKQEPDKDEFLNVIKLPLSELVRQVMAGEITDSKTRTAVLKAAKILEYPYFFGFIVACEILPRAETPLGSIFRGALGAAD